MKLPHYHTITTKLPHRFFMYYSYYLLYCGNCGSNIQYTLYRKINHSHGGILQNHYHIPKSNSGISIIQGFFVVLLNYHITTFSMEALQ
jgi:hypothetical protein